MIAAIYNRVSTEKQQQEGLSLQTQREACIKYAKQNGYDVPEKYILDEVFSGLTLDRPKLDTLLGWAKNHEVQAIVVYSTDRFSRDGYDLLTLVRECDINKVNLLCVSEDLGKGETGELINFIRGWASRLEATRIRERSLRNKRAKAELGVIPSGYGRYGGYFGLQYDSETRAFKHITGQIDTAKEILLRYAKGESSSSITKDLQSKSVVGAGGKLLHRSGVNRVLAHSRVYAGILHWNDIEITGKVEPIITEEIASVVEARLKLNREHSFGFGQRKWFSGRVFCGVCGRRYTMDKRKGCRCNANDSRSPISCDSPKVSYGLLDRLLAKALLLSYTDEEGVVTRAKETYQNWERDMAGLQDRQKRFEAELSTLNGRRDRLSFMLELKGLTEDEYANRLQIVQSRQDEIIETIADLDKFRTEKPIPADPEKVRAGFNWLKRLREEEPLLILLGKSPDRHRLGEQLADILNFKATIVPSDKEGFKVEVRVNLPLEPIQIEENSTCVMVFSTL
jgi:site-specific DNA recombinase